MRVDKGRSYQEGPDGTIALWDLDLAAFLLSNGNSLIDIWREGSEFRIVFRITLEEMRELHIKFLGSESGLFALCLKMLKKAAHSIGPRPPPAPPKP